MVNVLDAGLTETDWLEVETKDDQHEYSGLNGIEWLTGRD